MQDEDRRAKLGKTSTSDCSRNYEVRVGKLRGGMIKRDDSWSRLGHTREITLDNHKTSQ